MLSSFTILLKVAAECGTITSRKTKWNIFWLGKGLQKKDGGKERERMTERNRKMERKSD